MCLSYRRKIELEKIVNDFVSKFKLDFKEDVFKELNKIGFDVYRVKFKISGLSGMIFVNETIDKIDQFNSNKVILYSHDQDLYNTKFVLLHELSHYIMEKNKSSDKNVLFAVRDRRRDYNKYHHNINEQEMDYMAAALIIPKDEFLDKIVNYLTEHDKKFDESTRDELKEDTYFVQMMQKEYKTSDELVTRRIDEMLEIGEKDEEAFS